MSYDGIQSQVRFGDLTYQKINAKVVDNILNGQTYAMRLLGMGKSFVGKTMDFPIKIANSGLGEFFVGLETLDTSASDTLISLSYAQTAFTQPVVSIMLESFANDGPQQAINLDVYKMEEAQMEAIAKLGPAFYGTGSGNQPLGLGAIVDDGTAVGTIGGQSRTTYTTLKSTVTSWGTLTLAKMATLEDAITAGGMETEEPNLNLTTKADWSYYEQLIQPQARANYESFGGDVLPLRGNTVVKRSESGASAGFTALAYRGKPAIKDDACTTGVWFMLNERYFNWAGRTSVPEKYQGKLEAVSLGTPSTVEGTGAHTIPPKATGWFFQPYQLLPQQGGMVARYYVIGQVVATSFRRQGKGTGITGV